MIRNAESVFNGVQGNVRDAVELYLNDPGGYREQEGVLAGRNELMSRVDVTAFTAGSNIEFFSNGISTYGQNIDNGGLSGGEVFVAESLAFRIQFGYTVDGTAIADGELEDSDGTDALDVGETAAFAIQHGLVTLDVNSRKIIRGVYGLQNFPAGGGIDGFAAGWDADADRSIAVVNNGSPINGNGYPFTPKLVLGTNHRVDLKVKYPFTRACPDFVMQASLRGVWFSAG